MSAATDFIVSKNDLHDHAFTPSDAGAADALKEGEVLLKVEHFAFTANNVTYAAFGEAMSYWSFFPAGDETKGRIPVWGFATVAASRHPEIAEGERLYGYFPMSTHLKVSPVNVKKGSFFDGAAHRQGLADVYNQYLRVAADSSYDRAQEAFQMLFKPLFTTSFLIEDQLRDNDFYGAKAVVISSASAKTSIGLAFLLKKNGGARTVGLTSPGNADFVRALGCYDDVVLYDGIGDMNKEKSVFVDIAGNGDVRRAVHERLGTDLTYSMLVGGAHWDKGAGGADSLSGPQPEFFFAPTQVAKRMKDWGPAGFQNRVTEASSAFAGFAQGWMKVREGKGEAAIVATYQAALDGTIRPDEGHILSFG